MRMRWIPLLSLLFSGVASGAEFQDEVERDFTLRSLGEFQVTNLRGGISLQGWSQDRVRVKIRRVVEAGSEEEAKRLFAAMDVRFQKTGKAIELSAQYGHGLSLEERLRERKEPRTRMDLLISAPAHLKTRIWANEGGVDAKSWAGPLEVRKTAGKITVEGFKGADLTLLCPACWIHVQGAGGNLRCMAGTGEVQVSNFDGENVYVETTSGIQRLSRVSGEQLYVSQDGAIDGTELSGRIEFHTRGGRVDIRAAEGFLSGRTETGDVVAVLRRWKFLDKALIESVTGSIAMTVPAGFSGELDLWSAKKDTETNFVVRRPPQREVEDAGEQRRIRGFVGRGGEQLRLYSTDGAVRLFRGPS